MSTIQVVVGIIFNKKQVLLSQRTKNQFMAGFWEFAGGKIKNNETAIKALQREISEELGIEVKQAKYLTTITHKYPTKNINLQVFIIHKYLGNPQGLEGQKINWVNIVDINNYKILPTVIPLLNFAVLPQKYWITADNHYEKKWIERFNQQIKNGIKLIQLRSKINLNDCFVQEIYTKCKKNKIKLLLNIPNFSKYCDGYHLTSTKLIQATDKKYNFMSASAHTLSEAKKAETLGFDFIVLSPVKHTNSHPDTKPIGFKQAKQIATMINIPVYFLGGMKTSDLTQALKSNAKGIAGISLI